MHEEAQHALGQGDAETLRRAVHTLKANGKNFGATKFADLCQDLEKQAKSGELERAEEWLTQIVTEYENVKVALGDILT